MTSAVRSVLAALLLLAACANTRENPGRASALTTDSIAGITHRLHSGVEDPRRITIGDAETWQAFWDEVTEQDTPRPDLPLIDFDHRIVVAVALGTRPSGGYAIAIGDVFESSDGVFVEVIKSEPAPECATIQVVTAPVTAVHIARRDKPVAFVDRSETVAC